MIKIEEVQNFAKNEYRIVFKSIVWSLALVENMVR